MRILIFTLIPILSTLLGAPMAYGSKCDGIVSSLLDPDVASNNPEGFSALEEILKIVEPQVALDPMGTVYTDSGLKTIRQSLSYASKSFLISLFEIRDFARKHHNNPDSAGNKLFHPERHAIMSLLLSNSVAFDHLTSAARDYLNRIGPLILSERQLFYTRELNFVAGSLDGLMMKTKLDPGLKELVERLFQIAKEPNVDAALTVKFLLYLNSKAKRFQPSAGPLLFEIMSGKNKMERHVLGGVLTDQYEDHEGQMARSSFHMLDNPEKLKAFVKKHRPK